MEKKSHFKDIFQDLIMAKRGVSKSSSSSNEGVLEPLNRTFRDQIFLTPWKVFFAVKENLVAFDEPGVIKSEAQATKEPASEKEKMVESLTQFVAKETEHLEKPVLRFPGGEVESKDPARNIQMSNYQEEFPGKGIKCLFLTDYPRGEQKGELLSKGSMDLFLKITKAMGLEDKDFILKEVFETQELSRSSDSEKNGQMDIINLIGKHLPTVVLVLGASPTKVILGKKERLAKVRGTFFHRSISDINNKVHSFKVVPVFHPDFLLINPGMKSTTWADLQKVMNEFE